MPGAFRSCAAPGGRRRITSPPQPPPQSSDLCPVVGAAAACEHRRPRTCTDTPSMCAPRTVGTTRMLPTHAAPPLLPHPSSSSVFESGASVQYSFRFEHAAADGRVEGQRTGCIGRGNGSVGVIGGGREGIFYSRPSSLRQQRREKRKGRGGNNEPHIRGGAGVNLAPPA